MRIEWGEERKVTQITLFSSCAGCELNEKNRNESDHCEF